jgi:hypothetical protein
MTVTAQHMTAAEIARRHTGWVVWASRPAATRAAAGQPPRNDGTWAATLVCDTWEELDSQLAEQDQADRARQT